MAAGGGFRGRASVTKTTPTAAKALNAEINSSFFGGSFRPLGGWAANSFCFKGFVFRSVLVFVGVKRRPPAASCSVELGQ